MKRLSFWLTIIAGGTAAYLMYKRGESLSSIAKNTMTNPIGTFAHEIKEALQAGVGHKTCLDDTPILI